MKKLILFITAVILTSAFCCAEENSPTVIDLSGEWQFQIDRKEVGIAQKWFEKASFKDKILLPGSMPERMKGDLPSLTTDWTGSLYDSSFYFNPKLEKYRRPDKLSFPFFLTPQRHYKGQAWYVREVEVPQSWQGKVVTFSMERPHIKSMVWVNGIAIGSQNSFCVPHVYDVTTAIRPGEKNLVAVCVDNTNRDTPVGQDSHSLSDQTQGNWNGIVGDITLQAHNPIRFTEDGDFAAIEVYPNVTAKSAKVRIALQNDAADQSVLLRLKAVSYNHELTTCAENSKEVRLVANSEEPQVVELNLQGLTQLWDEFTPTLYRLEAEVLSADGQIAYDRQELSFGMREIECRGKWFYVNGRKTMMRGTVECCLFPLTGYAPMDVESWRKVFQTCRAYGLNHMRFHSYCPPKAAFVAADEVGFYLQPEGPSWPNHGVRLGRKEPIDTFLMDETRRLTREYGNHASFTMLAAGNEPAGNWVPWASKFVHYWMKKDPRRVYTGFSVGGGWAWQPENQFHAKAGVRGLDWNKSQPSTLSDYGAKIDTVRAPFVCHELGQWCVFPNFNEIDKYTGVVRAKNFEMFRDILSDNDMGHLAERFYMASGKLQALCYKHEIECLLRTKGYAGYQMLALNDYSGQGSAIVGILDVFFDDKDYITQEEWRQFCSPIVPLVRTPRFVYRNNETLPIHIEVSNFGANDLRHARVYYHLKDEKGNILARTQYSGAEKRLLDVYIPIGEQNKIVSHHFELEKLNLDKAQKLVLTVGVESEGVPEIKNTWEFWVYPAKVEAKKGRVYITQTLDEKARKVLAEGGDVLICAGGKVTYGQDVKQYFTPVFWNTSWFKMRPPHTTGIYLDETHPAFNDFPTEYHSNLQWWELLNRTPVMLFNDFPKGFQPLVQSIDTWFVSRKIGVLFEAKVLNGRLMMTTIDLEKDLNKRVVARQMRKSLLDYMNSSDFNPAFQVDIERIEDLFTKVAPAVDNYTVESPDELKPGYVKKKK